MVNDCVVLFAVEVYTFSIKKSKVRVGSGDGMGEKKERRPRIDKPK